MRQAFYYSDVANNLGVGLDFQSCMEGDFLTGHLYSHLSNNRGGWNKRGGWDFLEKTST